MNQELYTDEFYRLQKEGSYISATKILPFLLNNLSVKSIVDFGCGTGSWLKAAQNLDREIEVLGIDFGDNERQLYIKREEFRKEDLTAEIRANRKFDLVMSLEVAEHLPKESADTFVQTLCSHGNVVFFSAAFTLQGGVGHINEAPLSYWKQLFERQGYQMIDIRPVFWEDDDIKFWYRQNMVLFIKTCEQDIIDRFAKLTADAGAIVNILHPAGFLGQAQAANYLLKHLGGEIEKNVVTSLENLLEDLILYETVKAEIPQYLDKRKFTISLDKFDAAKRKRLEKLLRSVGII